jgi:TetR/AcrR family transcriptional regulator, copper-responsive repressor
MVQKHPKRSRGRPRAYDPDQALAQVMSVFWRSGFAGTSLDDLSEATGMNRPSLYGAFGDKRALYLKTLERYVAGGEQGLRAALNEPGSLEAALRRVYDRALALYLPDGGPPRGCFLITTAGTVALDDPDVRTLLATSLRGFDRAFEDRMRLSQERGELDAAADPALLAKMASAILHTLAVRSRAGDSRAALDATVDAGVRLICTRR